MTPRRARAIYLLGCRRADRRKAARGPEADAITQLLNTITFERDEWKAKAERLERENRAQRIVIQEQARQIHLADKRPSPAVTTPKPHSIRAAGDGLLERSL